MGGVQVGQQFLKRASRFQACWGEGLSEFWN